MVRPLNKLSVKTVQNAGPGRHSDGGGLYLVVSGDARRRWIFRFSKDGKVREMGLGSARDVTLAEARRKAEAARRTVDAGDDPIKARAVIRRVTPTFGAQADDLVEAMKPSWKNAKHSAQWEMTLLVYAKDLRDKPVDQITTDDVVAVLKPIWAEKPETASRLRGRIEAVLAAATARGHRTGANPAQWRNHLNRLLPKPKKLKKGHHRAMPFGDVPTFLKRLRVVGGSSAMALEFLILTAARTGEVLGAHWDEIDLEGRLWTIPATRMKAGRAHRVPLSDRAIDILATMAEVRAKDHPFIFPGQQAKAGLSGMALEMVLRRMDVDATPHGFRSSFRDWAGEKTAFPREVAEAALAHQVGDATERAYRRGDSLEKRQDLMRDWAAFCAGNAGNATQL
ncbi:MAG: tyrosine-type recombinase/integrase [Burkholderiales bacterium]|nr:tyrosine-type recombinase/integrase [Burkholderiales bacterium]